MKKSSKIVFEGKSSWYYANGLKEDKVILIGDDDLNEITDEITRLRGRIVRITIEDITDDED